MAFLVAHAVLGGARVDHALLGVAVLAFAYGGPRLAPWFRLLLPLALMGALYDAQGYVWRALSGRLTIHVVEPAAFDRVVFGIPAEGDVLTPAQWLQLHAHPVLDVICSLAYLMFIPAFAFVAAWIHLRGRRTGNGAWQREAQGMTWAFFWLGVMGCVTYYLYPAAPPWYADRYGYGPAIRDALPSAAGAGRLDALLGLPVFAGFYARTPNVFAAVPSLHAAIPLLAFGFAWRAGMLRVVTGAYALLVAFAAVYLNHHYVLDVLWGWAYVGVILFLTRNPAADARGEVMR